MTNTARTLVVSALVALGCNGTPAARTPAPDAQAPVSRPATDITPTPVTAIPGHESLAQDTAPKEAPRLMPAETLIRSYLTLFGGLSPIAFQTRMRTTTTGEALFDTWADYLSALGIPDYTADIPRAAQTNTLQLAAYERIAVALCERAVQNDLRGAAASAQVLFTFDLPAGRSLTDAEFATRFDVLHRRALGYPAALAPDTRVPRFLALYRSAETAHADAGVGSQRRFTGPEAGWAGVCEGLLRHPEFHLY